MSEKEDRNVVTSAESQGQNDKRIGNLGPNTEPDVVEIILDPKTLRNYPLQLGEFILIEYPQIPDKPVLASIVNIHAENTNMPRGMLVGPKSFDLLNRLEPLIREGERLRAVAKVFGYYDATRKEIVRPRYPPIPGSKVYRADEQLLQSIFQLGQLNVGHLRAHPNVRVYLDASELVRRHVAILAITGAGKGNTVAVLIEQMLQLNAAMIVIDPHEEYPALREALGQDKVVVFSPSGDPDKGYHPIQFQLRELSVNDIKELLKIPASASRQERVLREAIDYFIENDIAFNWEDLKEAIRTIAQNDNSLANSAAGIINRIENIEDAPIFTQIDQTLIYSDIAPCLVRPGQVTVISLAGVEQDVQQVVVGHLFKTLYEAGVNWRRNRDAEPRLPCPVFTIVEEAHNFVSPQIGGRGTQCAFQIKKIAAEGRKFGIGLCLVSQRPGKIDSDALSQCNTQIILRVVNPKDQSHIMQSAEAISEDLLQDLPGLNRGEAIIIGPTLKLPALVKIDKFKGSLGGEDIDPIVEWKRALEHPRTTESEFLRTEEVTVNYHDEEDDDIF